MGLSAFVRNGLSLFYRTGRAIIEHHTAADTLLEAETGSVHTNLGASGAVTITLPVAAAIPGVVFEFVVMVAQELRIEVGAAAVKLYLAGTISTDDGGADLYMTANDEAESVKLVSDGNGDWVAMGAVGTWTVVQP